jgi:glycosyltransferase involved in cell wall biosynthesis
MARLGDSIAREMPLSRLRIAFFSDRSPERMEPYMRGDWDTLSEFADVTWHSSLIGPGWRPGLGPTGWLPSPAVLAAVRRADLVFQWFATPSAPVLAARLLRRPSIVVAGGYDVAAIREIGYGQMLHWRTRVMGQLALTSASRVLAVSQATLAEVTRWAAGARAHVVYLGLDASRYPLGLEKRRQVVTIGAMSIEYLRRKGLDVFAKTSRLLPDVPFILVGRHVDAATVELVKKLGGPNLKLTGYLPYTALRQILKESCVYAQLSLHEGFGYAVAEAMLCGCQPVVTRAGALPEITGEVGIFAEGGPESVACAISQAWAASRPIAARERIVTCFPRVMRDQALARHVAALTGGSVS